MRWADTMEEGSQSIAQRHTQSLVGRVQVREERDLAIALTPSIGADYTRSLHVSLRIPVHPFPPYSGPWRLTPMHCPWPLVGGTKAVAGHLKEGVKGSSEECMFLALYL